MKKYVVPLNIKSCCNFKKYLFVIFDAAAKFMNFENLEKHFCNLAYKKKLVQTQTIDRNIYRKDFSAMIYRLPIFALRN